MARFRQAYAYYVKPYLGQRGQDLVEYALLLAIIVGIGYLIYQSSGLQESIQSVFENANSVARTAMPATRYTT